MQKRKLQISPLYYKDNLKSVNEIKNRCDATVLQPIMLQGVLTKRSLTGPVLSLLKVLGILNFWVFNVWPVSYHAGPTGEAAMTNIARKWFVPFKKKNFEDEHKITTPLFNN